MVAVWKFTEDEVYDRVRDLCKEYKIAYYDTVELVSFLKASGLIEIVDPPENYCYNDLQKKYVACDIRYNAGYGMNECYTCGLLEK